MSTTRKEFLAGSLAVGAITVLDGRGSNDDGTTGSGGSAGSGGSSDGGHLHSVDVTAAQLTELAANGSATVTSNDTHPHSWLITCA